MKEKASVAYYSTTFDFYAREKMEARQARGESEVYNLAQALAGGHDRVRGVHLTWFCVCGSWTTDSAYRTGRCNHCQTQRPA